VIERTAHTLETERGGKHGATGDNKTELDETIAEHLMNASTGGVQRTGVVRSGEWRVR